MKIGITAAQSRWWEWYSTCGLTAGQEQNTALLPSRHRQARIWSRQKTSWHLGNTSRTSWLQCIWERKAFCAWPTSGWSKEGQGKKAAKAKSTRLAQIQCKTRISMTPGHRLVLTLRLVQQIFPKPDLVTTPAPGSFPENPLCWTGPYLNREHAAFRLVLPRQLNKILYRAEQRCLTNPGFS